VTGARLLCFDLPACSSLRWHNIDFGLSTPQWPKLKLDTDEK
jgi:hypothetical protein